jgi:hypothetical protein
LTNGQDLFGFRLVGYQKVEDFVAPDEDSLGAWLTHLEQLTILTEIEEDYHFLK